MKIYLASSFDKESKQMVKDLSTELKARGHTITCEWWHVDYKSALEIEDDEEWYSHPMTRTIYQRSFKAIIDADMLILVAPKKKKFNGATIEVGIALGNYKPVVCFGQLERSGMFEPIIRCPTWQDLHKVLYEFEHH